jgi:hypothetical protein
MGYAVNAQNKRSPYFSSGYKELLFLGYEKVLFLAQGSTPVLNPENKNPLFLS